MQHLETAGRFTVPAAGKTNHWLEHLRVPALSVGTYSVPAGGVDTQSPHTEDEVYVVTAGRAVFEVAGRRVPARPGSVLYVPAGEAHRFVEVVEDLSVVVVFAPPEYSAARAGQPDCAEPQIACSVQTVVEHKQEGDPS